MLDDFLLGLKNVKQILQPTRRRQLPERVTLADHMDTSRELTV
jgi:hypothetical protein